jgi:hypothetical protein
VSLTASILPRTSPGRPVFFSHLSNTIPVSSPSCLAECLLVLVAHGLGVKAQPVVQALLAAVPGLLEVAPPLVVAPAVDLQLEGEDQLLLLQPPVVQSPRQVSQQDSCRPPPENNKPFCFEINLSLDFCCDACVYRVH